MKLKTIEELKKVDVWYQDTFIQSGIVKTEKRTSYKALKENHGVQAKINFSHISQFLEKEYEREIEAKDLTVDNRNGSVRKKLSEIIQEKKERAISGKLTEIEIEERRKARIPKYAKWDDEIREIEESTIYYIVVIKGYALDFKTGNHWKSKLPEGQHIRQSKLLGK